MTKEKEKIRKEVLDELLAKYRKASGTVPNNATIEER